MCATISERSYMLSEDLETMKVLERLSSDVQGQTIYPIQNDFIAITLRKW